jgi:hypothetical protein
MQETETVEAGEQRGSLCVAADPGAVSDLTVGGAGVFPHVDQCPAGSVGARVEQEPRHVRPGGIGIQGFVPGLRDELPSPLIASFDFGRDELRR